MTTCTICRQPAPGTDDADQAWCPDCFTANLAGAAPGTGGRGTLRDDPAWQALAALDAARARQARGAAREDGREA